MNFTSNSGRRSWITRRPGYPGSFGVISWILGTPQGKYLSAIPKLFDAQVRQRADLIHLHRLAKGLSKMQYTLTARSLESSSIEQVSLLRYTVYREPIILYLYIRISNNKPWQLLLDICNPTRNTLLVAGFVKRAWLDYLDSTSIAAKWYQKFRKTVLLL